MNRFIFYYFHKYICTTFFVERESRTNFFFQYFFQWEFSDWIRIVVLIVCILWHCMPFFFSLPLFHIDCGFLKLRQKRRWFFVVVFLLFCFTAHNIPTVKGFSRYHGCMSMAKQNENTHSFALTCQWHEAKFLSVIVLYVKNQRNIQYKRTIDRM